MKKLFILLILILLFTACGRGGDNEISDEPVQRTLTIMANDNFRGVIEHARLLLNASWIERGYNYRLAVNFEGHDMVDWDQNFEAIQAAQAAREARLRVELMSGRGPDLIFNENFYLHQFAQRGHLTDFYNLIENPDDFFMNPLKANEFRGGLYELPLMFGFYYIGINDNAPDSIRYRFKQLSYIRASDLLRLYFDFLDNYPDEFMRLGLWVMDILPYYLNLMNYIDLDTITVDFTPPSFIESFRLGNRVRFNMGLYGSGSGWGSPISWLDIIREDAATNMFRSLNNVLNPADAFIERDIPYSHFIPLANDYGSLVVRFGDFRFPSQATVTPRIWMPSAGDTELAWEFIYYLITAFSKTGDISRPWGRYSFNIPIMRSMFESDVRAAVNHISYLGTRPHFRDLGFQLETEEEINRALQNAMDSIYRHSNMPMVIRRPHLPTHLIFGNFLEGPMFEYAWGIITLQEAIVRAQNAMTL